MAVTLTFDNGPDLRATGRVLDILAARDVRATFFVVGTMLRRPGGRELVERAAADGHWIGNHSMTHTTPLGADPDAVYAESEITAMQQMLGDLSHERRFFRPFGEGGRFGTHLLSASAVDLLCADGYTCVLWSSVPKDWLNPTGWVETALHQIDALDHAVVVLHDLPTGAMDELPTFLDRLEDRGEEIVQDFPPDVIVIDRGIAKDLEGLVA